MTSEHSHFKQICKQAQQNKDLQKLMKDSNSEFMKQVRELQKGFAPDLLTNNDDKNYSQQSQTPQQSQASQLSNKYKKKK